MSPLRGFVVKLDATGAIDTSFGGGSGFVLVDSTYLHAVAIDSQGRIVASGEHIENPVYTSTVIRLTADGTLDDTFGAGGTATIDWDGAGESGYLTSMTLMADDRIVVGGFYEVYGSRPRQRFRAGAPCDRRHARYRIRRHRLARVP